MKQKTRILMTHEDIAETLENFAKSIRADYPDLERIAIVGIQTGGAHLARRLTGILHAMTEKTIDLGILDITLYRDDIAMKNNYPLVKQTHLPFKISGKIIILVDDVLYTGRTIRAALDAIIDFGRPKAIRLAVIIDRGLREFPIRPDYVGRAISTRPEEKILVDLIEEGVVKDQVILREGG